MDLNRKLKIFKSALKSGDTPFASIFVTRKNKKTKNNKKELTTKEWLKAIDILQDFGVKNISLNGFDPLLRDDIYDIINYAAVQKSNITWLFYDPQFMDIKKINKMRNLDFLCVILDKKLHSFDHHTEEILLKAFDMGITPAVLATIDHESIDHFSKIAEYIVKKNILFDFQFRQNLNGLYSSKHNNNRIAENKLKSFLKHIDKLRAETYRILPSYRLINECFEFYYNNNWKCPINKNPFIVIDSNGNLMPCQEYSSNISIFDCKDLKSDKWQKVKKEIINKCPGCSYTCYYQKTFRNPFDLLQEFITLLKF